MYECGKLKKVIGNKILFQVILEQCDFVKMKIHKKQRSFKKDLIPPNF